VTQPRAADDFPVIRERMEELRRERARPRAADDFAMIRARMEELRRERTQVLGEARGRSAIHPRACHRAASTRPSVKAGSGSPRVISGSELSGGGYVTAPPERPSLQPAPHDPRVKRGREEAASG
jgi:hypothetical protein